MVAMTPEDFFADHPLGLEVFQKVRSELLSLGRIDVRVTKSQVAFRRDRAFAYLWLPGHYLRKPGAEVVLSIALVGTLNGVPSPCFASNQRPGVANARDVNQRLPVDPSCCNGCHDTREPLRGSSLRA